uniref:MICOS complex subunit n=1 Tax=Sphenodon punctatus TaxID=8508 RepID=A0A8D0L0P2_SPHPU
MFKVMQLVAAPASLSLLTVQVYASSSEKGNFEKGNFKKELVKVDELSLYSSPTHKFRYVDDSQSPLEEFISKLRHSMGPYTAWCQALYVKAMPKVENAVEHGRESCEFLANAPPGFYPRLGVISFAGVVGLFLARGSKIKRLIYPVAFMGIGASLYYPQQAVAVAQVAGSQLYDWSLQGYVAVESLWKDGPKKKRSVKKATDKSEAVGSCEE